MEAVAPTPTIRGFGDRLADRVAERASHLVLGLDPDPAALWPRAIERAEAAGAAALPPQAAAARAVSHHCALALEAVAEHCVAVKLQIACFERLGAPGWAALRDVVARARERGLLVIGDAKRGDIDVSAGAYADAFLGATSTPWGMTSGVGVDALTVNPLLGIDSIAPFVTAARAAGAGVFVLVRTSNAGAADIQELELREGGTVSDRLAGIVTELGGAGVGSAGRSDVGAVVAATAPQRLARLRAMMPSAVLLIPGVGAQGGRIEDLRPAFATGPSGAIVSVSRGIVRAFERGGGDPAAAARAESARLRELLSSIAE